MMLMGNDCHDVFRKCAFGYFEGVQKKRFATSFSGRFRIAHGAAQPFSTWLHIESAESFADLQTCLVHLETLDVISLEPLYLWDFAEYRALEDEAVLYVFDRQEKEQSSFKATSTSQSILVGPYSKYCEVAEVLVDWKEKDPLMGRSKLLSIREEGSSEDMEAVVIQEV
jgi:hypothetical protein